MRERERCQGGILAGGDFAIAKYNRLPLDLVTRNKLNSEAANHVGGFCLLLGERRKVFGGGGAFFKKPPPRPPQRSKFSFYRLQKIWGCTTTHPQVVVGHWSKNKDFMFFSVEPLLFTGFSVIIVLTKILERIF